MGYHYCVWNWPFAGLADWRPTATGNARVPARLAQAGMNTPSHRQQADRD